MACATHLIRVFADGEFRAVGPAKTFDLRATGAEQGLQPAAPSLDRPTGPAIDYRLRDVRNSSYHGFHKSCRSEVGSLSRGPAMARLSALLEWQLHL